ncbi:MAG: PAS domain S-box protein [Candidatus Obscuribacterales bacterium]|nr:PAS domain S-box protein [Candidatus Obscuribacterales bacterium]
MQTTLRLVHKILVIEGNQDAAKHMVHKLDALQQQGLSFEQCICLEDGLRRLTRGDIDFILLDLSLPDSSGVATLKRVSEAAPSIPVIVLTETDDIEIAMQALACGAQDCLMKERLDLPTVCRAMNYAIARREAVESQQRLAAIVESSDDAIISKTINGTITSWNKGAEHLFGYTANEAKGHSIEMIVPPDKRTELQDLLQAVRQGQSIRNKETIRLKKDGQPVHVSATICPIKYDGTVSGVAAIDRDITIQRAADKTISETKQRLNLALSAGEVGVWDLDLINGEVWRSLEHDEIFGFSSQLPEWSLKTFFSRVLPEDVDRIKQTFEQGIKDGHYQCEFRIVRPDKSVRWLFAKGNTLYDENSIPCRVMGIIKDITERKEQEEQRNLLSILREREDFMATLTHDMKNPLVGANRLLELFISGTLGTLSTEQRDLLQCLMESNSGLLKLIANLIDVYKLEKDVNSLFTRDTDLTSLVSSCIHRRIPFAKLRGIAITSQLPEQLNSTNVDPDALTRVLDNLLDNAVKFAPDAGNVIVRLLIQDDHVVLEVQDNGPGVPSAEQSCLFKRFSQGDIGKRYAGGTGLGLYLCKQIVEAHGGTISCISETGSTVFRVQLPHPGANQ